VSGLVHEHEIVLGLVHEHEIVLVQITFSASLSVTIFLVARLILLLLARILFVPSIPRKVTQAIQPRLELQMLQTPLAACQIL
jgi:hypothetical protein